MAYLQKQNSREPDYRRLPTVEDLKRQTLVADKLHEDPGPSCLGARTRPMAIVLTLIGLATFVVPLVETHPTVMGQERWSPLQMVIGLMDGNLPAAVLLTKAGDHAVGWLALVNSLLFGTIFEYAMLAATLVFTLRSARRLQIGAAAALGVVATLIEMRGSSDIQLAILGGPPSMVGGQQVQALTLEIVMFAVMVLLLVIASWKELEDL